ncbi:aldo/keto reductase [Pseudothauera rhizosphaerae]|uniref:Protein tas n=1 Tax=Pseudothauera rhizosphaerae TaxID=2565932 RepID=A0A4S4ALQ4_9RHOO|nr:aldo/keto reductase [Pseudothauera rhizosphaerae]THF60467.1 aldo/keto reductase [Pseudothauera rhizosphaerae]
MEYRVLGEGGPKVSAVCLGTMTFGQQNTEAEAHSQLDHAVEHGINFIDTAELYAVPARAETYGASEAIVGNWLARQARERIVLATKVAGPARNLEWIRGGPPALDRANLRAAVEGSLRRLKTDYIDLYQLHWPERNQPMFGQWQYDPGKERECTPIRAQLEALAELVEEGKVRRIGLSNEHPWGVMQFVRLAEEFGLPRVVSLQNACNLLNRSFEYGLAEICHRERVGLLAYSPLAFGHLTGKYLADPQAPGRLTEFENFGQRYTKANVQPAVAAYAELARSRGLTPAALALGWIYHRGYVTSTIIGATTMAQLQENLAAWRVSPDAELLERIDAIHLRFTNPAP